MKNRKIARSYVWLQLCIRQLCVRVRARGRYAVIVSFTICDVLHCRFATYVRNAVGVSQPARHQTHIRTHKYSTQVCVEYFS
jgi:hypothetical protein